MSVPSLPHNCGGFRIESLAPHHFSEAVECVSVVWPSSNLIVKNGRALKISVDQMKTYSELLVKRAIEEDLSSVCIDNSNNKIVGFCLVEDLDAPPIPENDQLCEEFSIWREYTKMVENPYHTDFRSTDEKTIHVSMAGVMPVYEGLYLARLGMLLSMRKAWEKGYTKLFSVLTHSGSQGIASDRNATELYRVKFKDFQFKGTNPLAQIELESCSVIVIDLSDHTETNRYIKRMETFTQKDIVLCNSECIE